MKSQLIEECYKKSIDLLRNNSTPYGLLASAKTGKAKTRQYDSIFARDTGICSLGMAVSGNKKLIKTSEKCLTILARFQAANGQIPNYVKPETGRSDFWYLGCIDATLWWLIALKYFDKFARPDKPLGKRLANNAAGAVNWLKGQEHPKLFLLMQNEASDWADYMPRSGYVLYSNALWFMVKRLYSLNDAKETKQSFDYFFSPWRTMPESFLKKFIREKKIIRLARAGAKKSDYFLSFINYSFWGEDADVYGNALAILSGLANGKKADKVINSLLKLKKKKILPMPVLFNPIMENSKLWRGYMTIQRDNYPYQYHNGGIWPYASCFWAMSLARAGRRQEAEEELKRVALANRKNGWQFNEWLSPKTGQPMGMSGQSWNAGAFILAYWYLKGKAKI